MKDKAPLALAIVAMVAAALIVSVGTRWGPATNDDTLSYVMAAENAARGHGLSTLSPEGTFSPLTHYPPMVSLALVVPILLGAPPLVGFRLLYSLIFGGNILLTAAATRRLTRSLFLGIVAGVLVLISEVMILVYTEAMSDGLFLFLSLGTFLLLDRFLASRRMGTLALAVILAAATFLTRYVGGAVVLAGTLTLLRGRGREARSPKPAMAFLLAATIPMALWLGRNLTLSSNPFSRSVGWVPIDQGFFVQIVDVLFTWFLPGRLVHPIRNVLALMVVMAMVLGGALYLSRSAHSGRRSESVSSPLLWTLAAYIPIYIVALVIAKAFVDEGIFIDNRMLSPLFQPVIILLCVGIRRVRGTFGRRVVPAIAAGLLVLCVLWVQRAWSFLSYSYEWGRGYTSRGYSSSETITTLRRLEGVDVYTNAAAAVYLWTGRMVYSLNKADEIKESLAEPCAVIVLFHSISPELYGTTSEEIAKGLVRVQRQDGDFYFDPSCSGKLADLLEG